MTATISVPSSLLPNQRHFGCGPSAIRKQSVAKLGSSSLLGTSHRQAPVKDLVGHIRASLSDHLGVPDGWEVVLGNGGATAFWAIAAACLVEHQAACAVYGSFSGKCAKEMEKAPHLDQPRRVEAPLGSFTPLTATEGADAYCWAHNETSTGVTAPVTRVAGAEDALMLVDATSIAGAVPVDLAQTDAYYFSPQKAFAADGGLWFAILSPSAIERAERLSRSGDRWVPGILDLAQAIANSRKNQTLNTPAIATLELLGSQLDWFAELGGMPQVADRCRESSQILYTWAEQHPLAHPFVEDEALRSPVVATIEFDESVSAPALIAALRDNGILDVGPYRGVGANQIRVGCFPTIAPEDLRALTACLDYLLERL
ncbi:MAG: phosphoserine transaminase [Actinomycetaceae bacterium]|nr:phosphoserine transaminase [Actinomycetaceae bacterium]MDU0970646.1 phosphoserine transaminase [Actinomycetaceae bacterium]